MHIFHAPGQLLSIATPPNSDRVLVIGHLHIEGRRLVNVVAEDSNPPSAPGGPPDGLTNTESVKVETQPRSSGKHGDRRHFLTTPRRCPDSGHWTSRMIVTYEDGEVERSKSRTPCRDRSGG